MYLLFFLSCFFFFFLMIRRPPRSTLFPTRRSSDLADPGAPHYGSAKGALNQLTRCLAVELAPHNILVNAVAPGFIDRKSTRLNSSHRCISYAVFCLKKKKKKKQEYTR